MCVRYPCKDIIEQQFEKSKAHSVEFSAKAAARRKPPCCRVWMSLQQLFLLQFLYAAGFVGIAVSFLHSGASRVLLVQVVPLVEYLRGAGTFLLVLFKRFCFFRPLGKEGIRIQTRKTPLCYRLPMWALQTIGKTEASFYLRVPELPCYTIPDSQRKFPRPESVFQVLPKLSQRERSSLPWHNSCPM